MHMAKIGGGAAGNMFAHYDRGKGCRNRAEDNIDWSLTHRNYTIEADRVDGRIVTEVRPWVVAGTDEEGRDVWDARAGDSVRQIAEAKAAVEEQPGARKVRKDAVLAVDWVITLPEDVRPEDEEKFFRAAAEWFAGRYESVLPGRVHRDEPGARPHMHQPVVPLRYDEAKGQWRFSAKTMFDRRELRRIHPELGAHVDEVLGYHVSVQLDDSQRERKALSKVPHAELDAAKQAVEQHLEAETAQARAQAQAAEQAAEQAQGRLDAQKQAATVVAGQARDALAQRDAARDEKAEIERATEAARAAKAQAEAERDAAKAQAEAEAERLEGLQRDIGEAEGAIEAARDERDEAAGRVGAARERRDAARGRIAPLRAAAGRLVERLKAAGETLWGLPEAVTTWLWQHDVLDAYTLDPPDEDLDGPGAMAAVDQLPRQHREFSLSREMATARAAAPAYSQGRRSAGGPER